MFELQVPGLQVKLPELAEIEGSELFEGIALLRIRAEVFKVAIPLAMSRS